MIVEEITCANCPNPASYTFADPGAVPINYCDLHLPSWLRSRARMGGLPLLPSDLPTEAVAEVVAEAKERMAKDEEPKPEPKPKPKRTRKTAAAKEE